MSAGTESPNGDVPDEQVTESTVGRRAFLRSSVAAATAAGAAASAPTVAAQSYDGWFDDVDNYEGTVDYRGREEVTVAVGAGENGVLFEPPAILVDPGTTVTWEWTGEGGAHNVVHEAGEQADPAFESELQEEAESTFEYTFEEEEEAVYRYFCSPHRAIGMKGAVAVGNVDDELIEPDNGGGGGGGGGGQPLSLGDLLVAAFGFLLGIGLILAVVGRGLVQPNES